MKVLVLGSRGQLARSLVERAIGRSHIELIAIGRPKLDLEASGSAETLIGSVDPDVVINAAAYTQVDQAEGEPDRAFRMNAVAAAECAAATVGRARLIQLSTDYVFDGRSKTAYAEEADTNPLNVYGRSKLAGEQNVRSANPEHLIVRTSWVYSPFGRNFVRTIMAAAEQNDQLNVVDDQRGCPTSALDLAEGILCVIETWKDGSRKGLGETYHLAGTGTTSWYCLAQAVMNERRKRGLKTASIRPIHSEEWPTNADRPRNSALSSAKFQRDFSYRMPEWQSSLAEVIRRLAEQE